MHHICGWVYYIFLKNLIIICRVSKNIQHNFNLIDNLEVECRNKVKKKKVFFLIKTLNITAI